MKHMRKALSLFLALAMIICFAVPAFFHRLTIDAAASLADLVRRIGQPSGIQHL